MAGDNRGRSQPAGDPAGLRLLTTAHGRGIFPENDVYSIQIPGGHTPQVGTMGSTLREIIVVVCPRFVCTMSYIMRVQRKDHVFPWCVT